MALLVLGILLFATVHLVPSLGQGLKQNCISRLGENGYKGVFSLLLLASFGLMIFGWRSATPAFLYAPPAELRLPGLGLIALGFLIMGASTRNSRIRRFIRHPQLTGVALWGIAHLLLNGDSRSVILFSGMTLWAIIEIGAINRREGVWEKEPPPSWGDEVVTAIIALVTIAVFAYLHPWLSGVSII